MNPLQALFDHKTCRNYKPDPIPESILNEILLAGSRASTTGNMQVYSIIVSKEETSRQKLWEFHFKQNMVLQAPVILTFCADFKRFSTWCKQRKADPGYDNFLSFFTAAIDALLASQNVAIAAEAHGLGICYLGTTTYNAAKLIDFFKLPELVVPVTTLVVGYPNEDKGLTDRLPQSAIIHHETYTVADEKAIDEFYAEKESLPLTSQLLLENQLETLAQVFTEKRYTRKDNRLFSESLLAVLKQQSFMNNE